jgi:hypothetical protein
MRRDARVLAGGAASTLSRLLVVLLVALVAASPALAQSFLGTIRGTVTDPQGGAVAGADVLVVDESTGVPRPVKTDAEGRY